MQCAGEKAAQSHAAYGDLTAISPSVISEKKPWLFQMYLARGMQFNVFVKKSLCSFEIIVGKIVRDSCAAVDPRELADWQEAGAIGEAVMLAITPNIVLTPRENNIRSFFRCFFP